MSDDNTNVALGLGVVGLAVGGWLWWSHRRAPHAANAAAPTESYGEVDEVEALARVITSEAGSSRYTDEERRRIAWVVRNRAHRRGTTIAHLVCSPCGPQGKARPFASSQAATPASRQLAHEVLAAPANADPTAGSLAFFEPRVQDQLVASGRPGYRFTSAALRDKWQREGQRPTGAVGAFEFWA
jgi:hypothetical protein